MSGIQINIQLSKEDVIRANSIMMAENRSLVLHWSMQILGGIIGLVGVYSLLFAKNEVVNIAFTTFLAMTLISMIINKTYASSALNKVWNENRAWHSPIRVNISRSFIKVESVYEKCEEYWEGYKKAVETKEYFLLVHPNNTFLIMPKNSLNNADTVDEIRNFLKEQMKDKFYYRT